MALDRQSIEKSDFPIGSRGYDPAAVDAHLSALAEEIAEFKRSARQRSDTLASSASDQVRAIVEAAETSAADILRQAESEAHEIREEADREAQATREQASVQARDDVGKVSESLAAMLQRIDAMESELSSLIDTLRTSGHRLDSDLHLLEDNLRDVEAAVPPVPAFEPEDESLPAVAAPAPGFSDEYFGEEPELEPLESGPGGSPQPVAAAVEEIPVGAAGEGQSSDDTEGARLIALNMALNGTPRDETARYLAENFSLANGDALLDEVYSSVEG